MSFVSTAAAAAAATTTTTTKWSHATNSFAQMKRAITDESITSIECDVMMNSKGDEPILSHPPHRESDISVARCIELITKEESIKGDNDDDQHQQIERTILKDIKFDFKEINAVQPTFDILLNAKLSNPYQKKIILNADILLSSGQRDVTTNTTTTLPVDAHEFLTECLGFIRLMETKRIDMAFSLSLGYKCNWEERKEGYLPEDVSAMAKLVRQYGLDQSRIGLVLALNARCLSRSADVFHTFLLEFPNSKILAWTGKGEPAVTSAFLESIVHNHKSMGRERLEFDCDVTETQ